MAVRRIDTTNPDRAPGDVVTEPKLLVVHNQFSNADVDASAPSAALKLTPWEGTTAIELLPGGEVRVETRAGDWWGASLELDADVGENLSKFAQGQMHFDIRGSSDVNFSLGFQTGNFLRGDQVNNFASFGPGTDYEIGEEWRSVSLPIAEIDGGTDMTDVTNIVAFLSQEKHPAKRFSCVTSISASSGRSSASLHSNFCDDRRRDESNIDRVDRGEVCQQSSRKGDEKVQQ